MLRKKTIIKRVHNMKYFDATLSVVQDQVDRIQPHQEKSIQRFEREMVIAFKLKTINSYLKLPLTYDLLENPKKVITRAEYKRKALDPTLKSEVGTIAIDTTAFKSMAFYMEDKEWKNYEEAYNELIIKKTT